MSQQQNADKSGPSAKRPKSNDEENGAVVDVNGEQQLADIFKLNIHCFEEVFDLLSLKDLAAMGQTCKRMQSIAGHCFQQNYGAARARFQGYRFELYSDAYINIDCFSNFLQKIWVYNNCHKEEDESDDSDTENSSRFVTPLKYLTSIRRIKIGSEILKMSWINKMKVVLSKVDRLTIRYRYMDKNVTAELLAACSNVKYLSIDRSSSRRKDYKWMCRIYPALEHVKLRFFDQEEIPELIKIFELNTTIKQFSVNMKQFWSNRELFKKSNMKIDTLAIYYYDSDKNELQSFCPLFNEFYDRGFYKKLFFHNSLLLQENIVQLASVKGLVRLHDGLNCYYNIYKLGCLINLEELYLDDSRYITDWKLIPHTLPKLKRILLTTTNYDDILPFICHAKNLNKMKIKGYSTGLRSGTQNKVLDLIALNKEREKLVGARKITIYVAERVYLPTKWAMKQTEFEFIEMKRESSCDWNAFE